MMEALCFTVYWAECTEFPDNFVSHCADPRTEANPRLQQLICVDYDETPWNTGERHPDRRHRTSHQSRVL